MVTYQKQACKKCFTEYKSVVESYAKIPSCTCEEPDKPLVLALSKGLFDTLFSRGYTRNAGEPQQRHGAGE